MVFLTSDVVSSLKPLQELSLHPLRTLRPHHLLSRRTAEGQPTHLVPAEPLATLLQFLPVAVDDDACMRHFVLVGTGAFSTQHSGARR